MTSAPVGNVVDIMFTAKKDGMQSPKGDGDFAGSLKSAVEKNEQNGMSAHQDTVAEKGKTEEKVSRTSTDEKEVSVKETDSKKELNAEEKKDTDVVSETKTAETLSTVKDTVEEKTETLLSAISDLLDVDEEDIVKAMENLGIVPVQLFDQDVLTTLVMEVEGTDDPMSIVTDENLYQVLQNANTSVQEIETQILDSTGMSEEELASVLEQMQVQETTEVSEEAQVVAFDSTQNDSTEDAVITAAASDGEELVQTREVKQENKIVTQTQEGTEETNLQKDLQTENPVAKTQASADERGSETASDENAENMPKAEDLQQVQQTETPKEDTPSTMRREQPGHGADEQPVIADTANQNVTPLTETTNEIAYVQETNHEYTEHMADTNRIAEQIMDYMKVQVKEGITELEMQLHPASLGNVNVSLVSREGNLTAQFTAQNEEVRQVIETQLVQLREQFEEQGIKVDAVEVAVSNHQFEKQNGGNEQHQSSQKSTSGIRRTRRINLEELDEEELAQILDDSDKIQVEMMAQNGNTVDFTV